MKFHTTDYFKPTRSLNADDVLWTFQRALDPKHPWHASALRGYAYFDAMGMGELIKSVEKVDELTVRFVLNRPEAPFLRDMAMPFASIYSAEYGDQLLAAGKQGQLNNQPIGTGPFVFKRYAKDAQVRYTANRTTTPASRRSTIWCSPLPSIPTCACRRSVPASARSRCTRNRRTCRA